ncbi:MAG: hypothetical protein KIT17_01185 [Rubrivivax sp.]|nr:hypothetical protein [Rubrivivax sp.]
MYVLEEQSDIFVDAAAADHRGQLLFVSTYGRDTSIQQFMARLHQARREGGIEELSLRRPAGSEDWLQAESTDRGPAGVPFAADALQRQQMLQMPVGDPRRLQKVTGRMPRGLLGNLVHAWIFDPALLEADHSTRSGWVFERIGRAQPLDEPGVSGINGAGASAARGQLADRCWLLLKQLSPVPLLDPWREYIVSADATRSGLSLMTSRCVGRVHAVRVQIEEPFSRFVSDAVRRGALREEHAA